MNHKYTVTVGIPAHNEEANICYALESVLRQRVENFRFERVIVMLDGCTDNTERKVRQIQTQASVVEVVSDNQRKGKMTRLNDLYRSNTSDFLMTLDADVVFESDHDLEEMIKVFEEDEKINVVAAHEIPVKATTLVEKINNAGHRLWDETRLRVNRGNHIHNLRGSASMLRGAFARSLIYPADITADQGFLYIMATREHLNGFCYAYRAHILFRSPDNLHDCRLLGTRAIFNDKACLVPYFGEGVYNLFRIPLSYKIRAVSKMMFLHPFFTSLAILLGFYVRMFPLQDKILYQRGMWSMINSSKKSIKTSKAEYNI